MAILSRNELPKNETFPTAPVTVATSILITVGGAAACGTCRARDSASCTCSTRGIAVAVAVIIGGTGSIVIAVCGAVAIVATSVRYCELVAVVLRTSLCQL
jgi:ABC-type branched-subunit amino acid transport system permease subunit